MFRRMAAVFWSHSFGNFSVNDKVQYTVMR